MGRSLAAESGAAAPPAETRASGRLRRVAIPALSLMALVALWQVAALASGNPRLMPPPARVLAKIAADTATGELPWNLALTLARVTVSFAIAMTVGVALGILMGRVHLADELGKPWLVFFLNLPALVTIILCYVWIGLVETAALVAVALNKIPNVVVTVREGARALDPGLLEMAEVFRVPRGRRLRHVVLPQLYPYLAAAARSGLALIWKIVLVVELLGRSDGVGFQLGVYFQLFDVAGILAYALSFIAIVQLIEWGLIQPLERRVSQWRR